jgi:hypothetical protein
MDLTGVDASGSDADSISVDVSGAAEAAVVDISGPVEKLSFRTVESMIKNIYSDSNVTRSTALDILAIYLKGQKILYTEAETLCKRRLYALMIPAIVTSAACTLLGVQLKDDPNGGLIVAALNGFNSLLLALVSYLKLDAMAEAHKISAYKYDKLQAFCEFKSGKILFLNDDKDNVNQIIDEVETQVKEIKETNQFILPERIRYHFRQTYGQNVFSSVKEIQTEETILLNTLKGHINTLLTLSQMSGRSNEILEEEQRQNATINEIIQLRDRYLRIDDAFEREITAQIRRTRARCNCLALLNI